MNETHKILKVKTLAQKVAFLAEMRGQISDGAWENYGAGSRWMSDHWVDWTDCEIVVDVDQQGRNFHARKDNYQINSSELLSIVGERLLFKIKLALRLPGVMKLIERGSHWDLPESIEDYKHIVENANSDRPSDRDYFSGKLERLTAAGVDFNECTVAQFSTFYEWKDMRKDLAGLRKAMKTRIV